MTWSAHGLDTPRGIRWWDLAACLGTAPAMDITSPDDAIDAIDEYCAGCPVADDCDADAQRQLDRDAPRWHRVPDGVWGGRLYKAGKAKTAPPSQPTWEQCGDRYGAEVHRRRGEQPCIRCYAAERARHRRDRRRKREELSA